MNIIYYQTKTKFDNTGDALINRALIETLRKYGVLKCNCSDEIPEKFISELGIRESEKINVKNEIGFLLSILRDSRIAKKHGNKVYIVSGLGHNYGRSLKKCIRNIVASLIFLIYKIYEVKTVRIGMSIGPISRMLGITEKIRSVFIDYYYVRDTKSLELCHRIGIKKAKMCPDMSWLYDFDGERHANDNNDICINLRGTVDFNADEDYQEKVIKKCDEIIANLYRDGAKLYFCYQVLEDKDFCNYIYDRFKKKYNSELIEQQLGLDDASEIYSKCTYNISNRLHSLLLGYKYGALPIALLDQKKNFKIQQTMVDSGLGELSIDVYSDSSNNAERISQQKNDFASKLFEVEKKRQEEILTILEYIFN